MSYVLQANNFNYLYYKLYTEIITHGQKSKPRGLPITELIGYQFTLTDPTKSLCTITSRKLNYAFALIESLEYLRGVSNPTRICYYNKQLHNYTNLDGTFDGAYGPRISTQLPYVIDILTRDKDSRQAVITFRNESDCHDSKDIPCTLSLQFIIRNKKLHCIATMRSNDLLWGTPYDVHGFTFIQRHLAMLLGVDVGDYHHQVGSLHIYDSKFEKFDFFRSQRITNNMEIPILKAKTLDELYEKIDIFFDLEEKLRTGQMVINMRPELAVYENIIKNYIANK